MYPETALKGRRKRKKRLKIGPTGQHPGTRREGYAEATRSETAGGSKTGRDILGWQGFRGVEELRERDKFGKEAEGMSCEIFF